MSWPAVVTESSYVSDLLEVRQVVKSSSLVNASMISMCKEGDSCGGCGMTVYEAKEGIFIGYLTTESPPAFHHISKWTCSVTKAIQKGLLLGMGYSVFVGQCSHAEPTGNCLCHNKSIT